MEYNNTLSSLRQKLSVGFIDTTLFPTLTNSWQDCNDKITVRYFYASVWLLRLFILFFYHKDKQTANIHIEEGGKVFIFNPEK